MLTVWFILFLGRLRGHKKGSFLYKKVKLDSSIYTKRSCKTYQSLRSILSSEKKYIHIYKQDGTVEFNQELCAAYFPVFVI